MKGLLDKAHYGALVLLVLIPVLFGVAQRGPRELQSQQQVTERRVTEETRDVQTAAVT